ncbi:Hypothetical predicted protein [Mytilus galloprovincialis]|uniref:Uncharacterized protein n=1 Tax=Mytilus galloprovincialis TaxID=29158 RepID=A0A8B6D125_MYTGA|nr:Hypothetical predicted protein [Mytilus galloprovincialis]
MLLYLLKRVRYREKIHFLQIHGTGLGKVVKRSDKKLKEGYIAFLGRSILVFLYANSSLVVSKIEINGNDVFIGSALTWLKNFKEPEEMVASWLSLFETYDFKIEHRKGALHGNADALSRKPRCHWKRDEFVQCQNGSECEVNVYAITRSHLA